VNTDDFFPSTAVPSPARIYDYYLGGKDNFAVDRAAASPPLDAITAALTGKPWLPLPAIETAA
jgi:hypothetical protein